MKRMAMLLLWGTILTTLCAAQAHIRYFRQRGAATGTLGSEGSTAAHHTLPIGSLVKVTNTENEKEVYATITHRISVSVDRIVDLSAEAAEAIGVPADGSVPIILEWVNAVFDKYWLLY
ncbi:MAG: septal ring lytic transglycosylase RlpA family protein [Treponema sp.]|jgi:rare lipoprotein A|nr:septal ring lytic transglycosylase RlpA family protein [Treponema sp.]